MRAAESAVLTGVAALDVSTLGNGTGRPKRLYCAPCDSMWVDSPTCWNCFEPGVPYESYRATP